jgi:hypothetical protein
MSHEEESIQPKAFPDMQELCLNTPLFESFHIDEATAGEFWDIMRFNGHIDCYCLECLQPSVFHIEDSTWWGYDRANVQSILGERNHIFEYQFNCARNDSHKLILIFRLHNSNFMKIGQYPTIADLSIIEIQKYRKVLGNARYAEFNRAVGLVSHGIGIGAFVYLRRIFENLIEEAHQLHIALTDWGEDSYQACRMDGKIELLKQSLPDFLVQNKTLYSILSKGLHELSESECLNAFPVTKLGIELILDEKLEKLKREKKIKQASKDIGELAKKLKSDSIK